jgi:hypothetical protein
MVKKSIANIAKKRSWVRRVIQISFFTFVFLLTAAHVLPGWGITLPFSVASIHAICPFGAVETIGRLITQGNFIPKTNESNLWMFLAVAGSTILFGALFCGWLCPLGSVQDWVGRVGKKIFKKHYNHFVPKKLDRLLGYLRYIVLLLIVIDTTRMLSLTFAKVDPYYALFHFWTGEALFSAIAVLLLVLAASLFVERPWCRWFCPFGGVLGLLQLIAPWKIRRNTDLCTSCGLCTRACSVNIDVAKKVTVLDTRCNRCGECLAACPVADTLDHSLLSKNRSHKLSLNNRFLTSGIVLVLFFTPILAAKQAGLFKTSNTVEVVQGNLAIDDIKTTMTLDELAKGFNSTSESLLQYLDLPSDMPGDTKLKDIEDVVETATTRFIKSKMVEYSQ